MFSGQSDSLLDIEGSKTAFKILGLFKLISRGLWKQGKD